MMFEPLQKPKPVPPVPLSIQLSQTEYSKSKRGAIPRHCNTRYAVHIFGRDEPLVGQQRHGTTDSAVRDGKQISRRRERRPQSS
eukprot:188889-Rhodomonas_salina.2